MNTDVANDALYLAAIIEINGLVKKRNGIFHMIYVRVITSYLHNLQRSFNQK